MSIAQLHVHLTDKLAIHSERVKTVSTDFLAFKFNTVLGIRKNMHNEKIKTFRFPPRIHVKRSHKSVIRIYTFLTINARHNPSTRYSHEWSQTVQIMNQIYHRNFRMIMAIQMNLEQLLNQIQQGESQTQLFILKLCLYGVHTNKFRNSDQELTGWNHLTLTNCQDLVFF